MKESGTERLIREIEKSISEMREAGRRSVFMAIPPSMAGCEIALSRRFGVTVVCSPHIEKIIVMKKPENRFADGIKVSSIYMDEMPDWNPSQ